MSDRRTCETQMADEGLDVPPAISVWRIVVGVPMLLLAFPMQFVIAFKIAMLVTGKNFVVPDGTEFDIFNLGVLLALATFLTAISFPLGALFAYRELQRGPEAKPLGCLYALAFGLLPPILIIAGSGWILRGLGVGASRSGRAGRRV